MNSCAVKPAMLITDLAFALYWVLTAAGVFTVGADTTVQQWNWSFLGLDLLVIGLGLAS